VTTKENVSELQQTHQSVAKRIQHMN